MKSLTFKLGTALVTFLIGLSIATAWVLRVPPNGINPIYLSETSPDSSSYPTNNRALEMVFVLDTTGSMGGLLEGAKQRIWGIVNEVMQSSSKPAVRIGLVAYRDRGDAYVTQVLPLTNDLDKAYSTLMDYEAAGGGDEPENVRRALLDGVRRVGWAKDSSRVTQILFLVGDAPPHDDYGDEPDTTATAAEAVQKGLIVNTIQCGETSRTKQIWQMIAQRGQGQYFSIAQDGGVQAIATPYDEELGELASRLGKTFLAYGGGAGAAGETHRAAATAEMMTMDSKIASEAAPMAKAERAMNKVINAEAYVGDMLQDIENGSIKLDSIKDEDLASDLRSLTPEARKQEIDKRLAERRDVRARIVSLSKQREEFIAAERRKENGGKKTGFDAAVATALKEQLSRKGIK
jgi:Mg-chelatase subunit ChlD